MPTYEYACANCGNQWEEVQRITEPALQVCPKCKKHTAKRQISAGNFILKGGGWYSDAYSSPKPSANKSEDGGSETKASKDDSGGSTKSEGKGKEGKAKESTTTPKSEASAPKAAAGGSSSGGSSGGGSSGGDKST